MAETQNRQFILASRPVGLPKASDWTFQTLPPRACEAGEVLAGVEYISLDPAMRGWMNEGRSYVPPVKIGEVMRAGAIGRVLESKAEGFAPGDYVTGVLGVQTLLEELYATGDRQRLVAAKIDLRP